MVAWLRKLFASMPREPTPDELRKKAALDAWWAEHGQHVARLRYAPDTGLPLQWGVAAVQCGPYSTVTGEHLGEYHVSVGVRTVRRSGDRLYATYYAYDCSTHTVHHAR